MNREALETNRRNWESRVPIHAKSDLYDLDRFVQERKSRIGPIEQEEVGDVAGKSLLHIQCHIGTDTLSWALSGAEVTGVDFSPSALEQARALADQMSLAADFYEGDAQDFDLNKQFDIVFASRGIFCWIENLDSWMVAAARHMKKDGVLYVFETHPFTWGLDDEASRPEFSSELGYFDKHPYTEEPEFSYAGSERLESPKVFEWQHTVEEIFNAAFGAGLQVEFFHEHPVDYFQRYSYYIGDGHYWRIPSNSLPLTFSLRAHK